jgi:outer membrane scaffolding protein for murein synthesis (MipA/OmpV family)
LIRSVFIAVPALLAASAAVAQQPARAPATSDDWIVSLRANGMVSPEWLGSDKFGVVVYPSLSFRRAGTPERFSAPDDGLSIGVMAAPWLRIGAVARYRGGRFDGDDRRLTGIRDVGNALEPGLFAEIWPLGDTFRTRIEVRRGMFGHHGFVGTFAADVVQRTGAFTVAVGPRLTIGDGDFMKRYFSVSPLEATLNPNVTAYSAGGGAASAGLAGSLTYRVNEAWSTTVHGGYERLVGDASSSPVVRNIGSRDQFTFGLSATYSFGFSRQK